MALDFINILREYKEERLTPVIAEFLNYRFDLNLATPPKEKKIPRFPDLWQGYDNASDPKGIVQIKTRWSTKGAINQANTYIKEFTPEKYILVVLKSITQTSRNEFLEKLTKSVPEVIILDINDLNSALRVIPELDERLSQLIIELDSKRASDISRPKKTQYKNQFFVAGFHWNRTENKFDDFIKERRWENGHDEEFTDIVNSVKVGDIILAKTSWAKGTQSIITIYGVGVVFKNYQDGHNLDVNWKRFNEAIDLKVGTHYRSAIHLIENDYLDPMMGKLESSIPNLGEIINELATDEGEQKFQFDWSILREEIAESTKFWYLRDEEKTWGLHTFEVGKVHGFGLNKKDLARIGVNDIILVNNSPEGLIWGVFKVTAVMNRHVECEYLHEFIKKPKIDDLLDKKELYDSGFPDMILIKISELTFDQFKWIVEESELNLSQQQNRSRIANISHDAIDGDDYLGIEKDVTAFAKVIASNSFTPPLAIALFGQWGTGKSFFMKKLMTRIEGLSKSGNELYQAGIAQIHFNAWSYLDTNLFASIVAEVFEKLDEYISGNKKAEVRLRNIEKELTEKLSVAGKHQELLRKKKEDHIKSIRGLRKRIIETEKEASEKIDGIKSLNAKEVFEEVDRQLNVKKKLNDAISSTSLAKEITDTIQPESVLKELKSIQNFMRESLKLIKSDTTGICIFIVILLGSIGLGFLPFLEGIKVATPQFILAFIAPIPIILRSISGAVNLITPVISKVNAINDERSRLITEIKSKYEQDQLTAKLDIERKNLEIKNLNQEIYALEANYNKINYLLKHNLKQRAVYSFINERSKSEEYQKYLGVVSTIRKDFEILSDLFDQSKTEGEDFRGHFERPLERIVLYIDDLDRCKEDQVIQVLEAVNLLMAFPLFVVVVGVDPRWVKNALIKEYHMQFAGVGKENIGIEPIEASNYLEKIFQVPFHLEEAEDSSVKEMLRELCKPIVQEQDLEEEGEEEQQEVPTPEKSKKAKPAPEPKKQPKPTEPKKKRADSELLSLSDSERDLIQEMSEIIGTNPRAIKRFVNVYHILRAHEGLGAEPQSDKEYLMLMLLLAIPIGPYRKLYSELSNGSMAKGETFEKFLKADSGENKELKNIKERLKKCVLKTQNSEELLAFKVEELHKQNKFVQRFTFSELT